MGPYCHYCDQRCFVPRLIPNGGPWEVWFATCPKGMESDREKTGYDHTTAINPAKKSH